MMAARQYHCFLTSGSNRKPVKDKEVTWRRYESLVFKFILKFFGGGVHEKKDKLGIKCGIMRYKSYFKKF